MAIQDELDAFQKMKADLEAKCMGKWVLIHQGQLISTYASFEEAATDAVLRFGGGPYLIRQVGAPPPTLPVSVMFHPRNAQR